MSKRKTINCDASHELSVLPTPDGFLISAADSTKRIRIKLDDFAVCTIMHGMHMVLAKRLSRYEYLKDIIHARPQ